MATRMPSMTDLSGYLLVSLREGPDFTLYRGQRNGSPSPVFAVEPLSNLMASGQIHRADCIRVTHRQGSRFLKFIRETEPWKRRKLRRALLRRSV